MVVKGDLPADRTQGYHIDPRKALTCVHPLCRYPTTSRGKLAVCVTLLHVVELTLLLTADGIARE